MTVLLVSAVGPTEPWIELLNKAMPGEVVFPALHGPWGEGGPMQDLLERDGRPFVGANAQAARLGEQLRLVRGVCRRGPRHSNFQLRVGEVRDRVDQDVNVLVSLDGRWKKEIRPSVVLRSGKFIEGLAVDAVRDDPEDMFRNAQLLADQAGCRLARKNHPSCTSQPQADEPF